MALESYSEARFHLEKAEMIADSSSFGLETVQTMILVARFETTNLSAAKGILTIARLMQVINLLGYDTLDGSSPGIEQDSFKTLIPIEIISSRDTQEVRQTYWISYAMHCNASTSFSRCIPIIEENVCLTYSRNSHAIADTTIRSGLLC